VPDCYMLTACSGSSLDQGSNNVTLFNLVEQINVPEGQPLPAGQLVPIELHSYWKFGTEELKTEFETRFVLVSLETGLEAPSEIARHKVLTSQLRTRTMGLPLPPVAGTYELRTDWRVVGNEGWNRDDSVWPMRVIERSQAKPSIH
jgi:hypothetical protein